MASPYVIAYFAIAVMGVVYLVVLHLLFERLASRHNSTWQALGSPRFFSSLRLDALGKLARFVARGEYRPLQDSALKWLCVGAVVLLAVCVLGSLFLQAVFYRSGGHWPAA